MKQRITRDKFDAVLFDLDGVLTDTAKVHASCWKKMFDDFLQRHAAAVNKPFRPFDIQNDYMPYVDGKPRYEGVSSFLKSRHIDLPYGSPDSPSHEESVCGLGNRKSDMIQDILASEGVDAYEGSIALVHKLRRDGIKTAVVSSSQNCEPVLRAAGILDLFDTRVDGQVAVQLNLPGKPAPDTFLWAARELGVQPERAVVVEDAISGVEAGRSGSFGLVVGVDRGAGAQALSEKGADIVVTDLAELL